MKHLMVVLFTIFSHTLLAQIKIDQSGEGWKEMVESARISYDREIQKELWKISEEMTGITTI